MEWFGLAWCCPVRSPFRLLRAFASRELRPFTDLRAFPLHIGLPIGRAAGLFRVRGRPLWSAWSLLPLLLAVPADRPCHRAGKEGFANARPWSKAAASRTHSKGAFSKLNGPAGNYWRNGQRHGDG